MLVSTLENLEEYKLAGDFANLILSWSTLSTKYIPSPPVSPPNNEDAILVSSIVSPSPAATVVTTFWGV